MANFWESFLNTSPRGLDDPGDPSMPYGPPLWPTPEQSAANRRSYDSLRSDQQFRQPQLEADPQWGNQSAAVYGSSRPVQRAAIGSQSPLPRPSAPGAENQVQEAMARIGPFLEVLKS